jgi:hypothetical protein
MAIGMSVAISMASTSVMAQQCAAVPSGAIAWFRGDRNADDSAGFYNAALYQGTTYAAGQVGEAFHLDGVNDQVYGDVVTGAEQRAVRNAFTYELWARPSRTLGTCPQGAGGNCSGNNLAWAIFPTHGDNSGPPQEIGQAAGVGVAIGTDGICAGTHATNMVDCLARIDTPIPSGTFTHVAVVVENKTPRIYIDGVLAHTGVPSNKSFVFASWQMLGFTSLGGFGGELDEVTAYGRALSDGEIAALFAAGTSGKCHAACPAERHDDAWENPTVLNTSGVLQNSLGMFGNPGGSFESGTTLFADNQPDGTVHAIEWQTAAPMLLDGFNLSASHGEGNTQRAFRRFKLQARPIGGNYVTVYEQDVATPYAVGSAQLLRCPRLRPASQVQQFRAEFTQEGAAGLSGPRVIELDAGTDLIFRDGFQLTQ